MSSYDKVVKMACKPKAAPPKAKYIDPIIAATWSDDGAVHDVCKALSPRIREPNAIVVFKALIVLHTMIRNGATDNVLSYLSTSEVLRLRNVATGNWEGYHTPQNLQNYALYLDSRIRAYKDLKHDAVKVQAESNRDMRNSVSIEEDGYRGRKDRNAKANASVPSRSKTVMGRKLRSMTVEKGLLRETKAVHNMINTLVECRFYLDDLEDELTITALRMLVKDLLILFQAGNEGVINVLEHYFEMSHIDAEEALKIYRHFCKQTEYVVEYLGVAKKLQNLLNVPVPNLKHAPVSLVGALQEYLDDPNFEQNRIEYKTNKDNAERATRSRANTNGSVSASSQTENKPSSSKVTFAVSPKDSSTPKPANEKGNKDILDFFSAIEEEQPTNSPTAAYFQQQGATNPFARPPNGQPYPQPRQLPVQPAGFLIPQHTVMPQQPNPFGNFLSPQVVPHQTGHRPFSSYLPLQAPVSVQQHLPQSNFLQPQATGVNPFRQSMLVPQATGMAVFGNAAPSAATPNTFLVNSMNISSAPAPSDASAVTGTSSQPPNSAPFTAPRPSFFGTTGTDDTPTRPASTPLTSIASSSSSLQPVKAHQTGTRNPFGPIVISPPPVPKQPTLFELSTMSQSNAKTPNRTLTNQEPTQLNQPPSQSVPQQSGGFSFNNSSLNPGASDISSVASSFSFATSRTNPDTSKFSNGVNALASQNTSTMATTTSGSTFSHSLLSSFSTGATNPSSQLSSIPALKSHVTGFQGLQPFIPSSSFGASLMESLPPIPGSGSATPVTAGLPFTSPTASSGFSSNANNFSFPSSQPTGVTGGPASTLRVGLRPQMTGGGSANPFRASMAANSVPNFGTNSFQPPLPNFSGLQPFNANKLGDQQKQSTTTTTSLF